MHGNSQNTAPATHQQTQPQQPQPYSVQHEFGGSTELTTTLVHAISDVTGADVTQAEFQLDNYVDADALNRLFRPASNGTQRAGGHLTFTVWDHQVTVYHNGQIVITPPSNSHTH